MASPQWDAINAANRKALLQAPSPIDEPEFEPQDMPAAGALPPSPGPVNTAGPVASAPRTASPSPAAATGYGATPAGQLEQQFWGLFPGQSGGAGTLTPQQLQAQSAELAKLGITLHGGTGGDNVRLPDGRLIDVIGDVGGKNQAMWHDPTRFAAGGDLAGRGGSGGSGGGGQVGAGLTGGGGSELDAAVRAQLLQLIQGANAPIDTANDPRAAAYRRARERGAVGERAQAAERAAFLGLNSGGAGSGAFEANLQGIQEGAGEDIASFEADLQGEEVQARRTQLMQALDLANAVGARSESLALQRELANLDNTYRYKALSQQKGQWDDSFGLDKATRPAEIDRDFLLDLLRDR